MHICGRLRFQMNLNFRLTHHLTQAHAHSTKFLATIFTFGCVQFVCILFYYISVRPKGSIPMVRLKNNNDLCSSQYHYCCFEICEWNLSLKMRNLILIETCNLLMNRQTFNTGRSRFSLSHRLILPVFLTDEHPYVMRQMSSELFGSAEIS